MPAQFDGDNLVITLHAGGSVHEVNVGQDLYSDWKEWMLLSDNMKYPPAFAESEGGFETVPGVKAGAYYFLRNDLGWRIRPAEEDSNITFTGNLVPSDSTLPMIITTVGDFMVLINGLQPITTATDSAEVEDIHAAHFNRRTRNPSTGDEVIYESDGVTPRHNFTTTDDGSQITEITPA